MASEMMTPIGGYPFTVNCPVADVLSSSDTVTSYSPFGTLMNANALLRIEVFGYT
jgi:hypothetical protein